MINNDVPHQFAEMHYATKYNIFCLHRLVELLRVNGYNNFKRCEKYEKAEK